MYYYMKGTVAETFEDSVVIENNDMGYQVYMPAYALSEIALLKQSHTKVFLVEVIKEDEHTLYGFTDEDGQVLFKQLMTVNGVGAKAAMALLSAFNPSELKQTIVMEDPKSLSKAQGIGMKTAQRIIIDLKDKVSYTGGQTTSFSQGSGLSIGGTIKEEALDAMIMLGYTKTEASVVLNKIEQEGVSPETSEQYIKLALKRL